MTSIKILGTGMYLPEFVATNEDYAKFVETSDEWIRTRTGMQERHIALNEPTWYLGAKSAEMAIKNAGIDPQEIDLIVVTTVSADYYTPSMACFIQRHLGIKETMSMDINVACTAYSFGFDLARRYLAMGDIRNVLLVAAESLSQVTDYTDRASCVLFGDGAGATVITKAESLYGAYQTAEPFGTEYLYGRRPRKSLPFTDDSSTDALEPFSVDTQDFLYMNGPEVYKFAVKAMPRAIEKACAKAGITIDDLDLIIPHQANLRIIETAVKKLKIPSEKVFVNIEKYGNTSSASTAIALHEAVSAGRLKRGDKLCVVCFGAGLTYGATIFEY